jgi:hypothetical protein
MHAKFRLNRFQRKNGFGYNIPHFRRYSRHNPHFAASNFPMSRIVTPVYVTGTLLPAVGAGKGGVTIAGISGANQ